MVKTIKSFAVLKDGRSVDKYIIENNIGNRVELLSLGATIQSIYIKNCKGNLLDIALGYDDVEKYLSSDFQGATVGPYANRINEGSFSLSGKKYSLDKNDGGQNSLHSNRILTNDVWEARVVNDNTVKFSTLTKDGEKGYPGNISFELLYSFSDDNSLSMEYRASSDKETLINPTNHAYFNLSGYDSGSILNTKLQINASSFTPVGKDKIPTGEILSVKDTPLTFLEPKIIGERINEGFAQLKNTGGYDHNFCIDNADGSLIKAAAAYDKNSGICLEVFTTLPGIQFYAGNFLNGEIGKNNEPMNKRCGFCLETQYFPDTPNHENFPQCTFLAGEKYYSKTIYKFSLK